MSSTKKPLNIVLKVVKEPEANKYLPHPLTVGQKVLLLCFKSGTGSDKNAYAVIKHGANTSTFRAHIFKKV